MFSLIDLLNQQPAAAGYLEKIGILDIGAMMLQGMPKEYCSISDRGYARVVGFEPVAKECERLNLRYQNTGMRFLPYFIGNGDTQNFYLTNHSMTASLFEPNFKLLNLFENLSEHLQIVSVEKVSTHRLDDIKEIDFPVEYIKMDIQGAELQALQGATRKLLKDVLVIHTEVAWVELYKNQPLFAEIDSFLRAHGFILHKILGYGSRHFKLTSGKATAGTGEQMLWSDVVFMRDFSRLDLFNDQQLLKMAIIVHDLYSSVEIACIMLEEFDRRTGKNLAKIYVNELAKETLKETQKQTGEASPATGTPGDFVALYSAGVEAFNNGDTSKALNLFETAARINAAFAPLWYNLGLINGKIGKFPQALTFLDEALKLDSGYAEARTLRNSIAAEIENRALDQGGMKLATINSDRLATAIDLQNAGKLDEAEKIFLEILQKTPDDVPCLFSLGGVEHNRRNPEKALEYFKRALAVKSDYPPIWFNLGIVQQSLKQFDAALESYEKALSLDPAYFEAMQNKGSLLAEMRRHKDALLTYEELLKHDPSNTKALCNRGILLSEVKFHDLAIHTFERLYALDPNYDFAAGLLCFAKMHACQWENLDKLSAEIIAGVRAGRKMTQTLPITAISPDPNDHLLCARTFGNHHCPARPPVWQGERYQHPKIRIGYVSPDLREHPVGHLTTGLFENHDKNQFELTAFSLGIDDQSVIQKRMRQAFDKFIDIRMMKSKDIAELIRSMEIDILVDMAGYTADSRSDIFACRPAPVQVNYLGYSSTMGVDFIDYMIADRNIIPEECRQFYSEKIVYLPDTYLPTDASVKIAENIPHREFYGLPSEGFIFCSFNHDYKINPPMFDIWMRLLNKVPGSVLWLMKLNESAERNLLQEAEKRGIEPSRIIFATRVANIEDHLARYCMADLFLDTSPCNAHSTASDVLRAGLPLLTCSTKAFAGRVAGSLLKLVGLPELVTTSLDAYENLALELATNPQRLSEIRKKLAGNIQNSVLFDTTTYCRNLEKAYRKMQEKSQRGEKPDHFEVQ